MSIGLVEELSRPPHNKTVVTYFFCQNVDASLNTVEAIIKGLIRQLIREQAELVQELRDQWNQEKGQFPDTVNSWQGLWDILLAMLDRCKHEKVYIVVDALDECQESIEQLLARIVSTGLDRPSQVKWLLTSRPLDIAEQTLLTRSNQTLVSLEVNLDHVVQSIAAYVSMKVTELSRRWRRCSLDLRQTVEDKLIRKAAGTFLWVSLVCKELQTVVAEDALSTIEKVPPGLQAIYGHAYRKLCEGDFTDVTGCTHLLRVMMLAYRPLNMLEVCSMMDLAPDSRKVQSFIDRSASFVQVQGQDVQYLTFIHQSARDYLAGLGSSVPEGIGTSVGHSEIAIRAVSHLTNHLMANLLQYPDTTATREQMVKDGTNPLTSLGYAAEYWIQHSVAAGDAESNRTALRKSKSVERFLQSCFLEWLECLSLMDQLPRAVEGLQMLVTILDKDTKVSYRILLLFRLRWLLANTRGLLAWRDIASAAFSARYDPLLNTSLPDDLPLAAAVVQLRNPLQPRAQHSQANKPRAAP